MIKIGITGQSGFIGSHLYNSLGLYPNDFERIPFSDDFFSDTNKLNEFVKKCDVIVHLAAMNRHVDQNLIYTTNIGLVKKLIQSLEETDSRPHILFSSSIQEEKDNLYGKSKKEGRELLKIWASNNQAHYTGLVIPNVFGPFCKPFYNSFISTFSYQLVNNKIPQIEVDSDVKLIYIGELIAEILQCIKSQNSSSEYFIEHTSEKRVSEVLNKLKYFKDAYIANGTIPRLFNSFDRNLFNTFRSYIDSESFFPFLLKKNDDNRGTFVEIIKAETGGQVSYSTTNPGVTRGNHFHTRKIERFAVIKGEALIELRQIGTSEIKRFKLSENNPAFVDMPIWYTHNITNTGKKELVTMFWINEFFDPSDPDTFFESV